MLWRGAGRSRRFWGARIAVPMLAMGPMSMVGSVAVGLSLSLSLSLNLNLSLRRSSLGNPTVNGDSDSFPLERNPIIKMLPKFPSNSHHTDKIHGQHTS